MKTVRKLLYGQILSSVLFTTLAFLGLFFFFDMVEELQDVGKHGITTLDAVTAALLMLPRHLYEVFPITLLIGTIVALSRLAQTSEFTILRTGGLGPVRALRLLATLAVMGVVLMVVLGDLLVPWTEQWAATHKAQLRQGAGMPLQQGGAWLRDTQATTTTVNVGGATNDKELQNVRIFMTNDKGQLVKQWHAAQATIDADPSGQHASIWQLRQVTELTWLPSSNSTQLQSMQLSVLSWPSQLSPQVVAAAVLPIDSMSIVALWRYTRHLSANAQAAQKYELQFWKKTFAPLACLVMVSLALPFAYLQARQGGMAVKIFGGIMLGISFVLVNHVTSHLGLLHQWEPWMAASVPSVFYTLMAMGAFTWLVRNR
jgi:lipopolysaccharide export system permease protein